MKIVARCPRCGARIPRYFVLALGLPVGLLIALGAIGYLSWFFVIIDIAILGALGVIAFPYLTTFVAAPDEDDDQTGS